MEIEFLYKKYAPMVFRRCKSLLKNDDAAADAMQDVFLQVIKKRSSLNLERPSSLLYTIATNICLNIIRKNSKTKEFSSNDILDIIAGEDNHEKIIMAKSLIDNIFENEKHNTKTIAVLHYIDGFTLEETAKEVGMSISGIRKRLRKIRKKSLELEEI